MTLSKIDQLLFKIGLVIIGFFTLAYCLLTLNKYWQFEYFFVDNVYFHQALWKLSRFETPDVDHPVLGKINIFGDHFHPVIIIVAMLMAIFPRNETVFIIMSLIYGFSAFFALKVAFKLLKNKILALSLLIPYFTYLGVQNAFLFGFHEINFLPLFFMLLLYAYFNKKKLLFVLAYLLLLLTKESMVFIALILCVFWYFQEKKRRKQILILALLTILYYLIVTHLLMPIIAGRGNLYNFEFIWKLSWIFEKLFKPNEKISTFLISTASYSFLSFFDPIGLLLILQDFFIRYFFSIPGNIQYTLGFHYGIALSPLLFFSSLLGYKNIEKFLIKHQKYQFSYFLVVLILLSNFYYIFFKFGRSPLFLIFNPAFYQNSHNNQFLFNFISHVPKDGSIMTQNHLGLMFSDREVMKMVNDFEMVLYYAPDYLVYDLRSEQNPNNFFPIDQLKLQQTTEKLISLNKYEVYYHHNDQYILKKIP